MIYVLLVAAIWLAAARAAYVWMTHELEKEGDQ